ncbi:phospholipase C [Acidithiobacillus sulfurivorans]|uniref:phospholipase C n=1 Tax=Acidithiobacillus sulfurivorans TaxID=1958756 RepID=A0ABS5ZU43_9PROT|nr:alkaline phosphatase family protein [Acidithiobacillus sulfurivorans]MBU2758722.1 alkaline phosphatase family protein [Acidithiobacillus sulfurivorans]
MTKTIYRRDFMKQMLGITAGIITAPYLMTSAKATGTTSYNQLRNNIDHIVVIFQENRGFDHYFGTYRSPHGAKILNLLNAQGEVDPRFTGLQKDISGTPYQTLPLPKDVPGFQNVTLMNKPFHLEPYIPSDSGVRWNPTHHFFRMRAEINNGKMDRFVALALGQKNVHLSPKDLETFSPDQLARSLSAPTGPVLGYYERADIPFYHQLADKHVLFDRFFQAMSGGSTGNALYLAAARSCINTKAPVDRRSPANPPFDAREHPFYDLPYNHEGVLINDINPVQGPTVVRSDKFPADYPPPEEQTYANIGDRLQSAGLDWAWYNENWEMVKPWAMKSAFDRGDGSAVIDEIHESHYVPHHNPFQYYQRWYDYVRQGHMRSTNDFVDDARSGKLPPVSFIKAAGPRSEHPGEDTPVAGMNWVESLLKAVSEGPAWGKTAIFITYDEGGGFWDSVPPPQLDAFGLGTRTPALLVSPFSRSGLVDHHLAHTGSILKLIETRFGLDPLNERDRHAYDMLAAFDFDQAPKALL